MPIKVNFGGDSWLVDDLTLAEFAKIERTTGATWTIFNPLLSSVQAAACLQAFLSRTISVEAAEAKVAAMSIREAAECFDVVDDDELPAVFEEGIPKAEGETEMDGSSPAPSDSDGPPT